MSMEFWGIEVKSKEPCNVKPEEDYVIHLSQATLSAIKKDMDPVIVHVKVGDQKLVLGVLNQTTPQLSFDLVFEKEFEISHNWKNGSVHFLGYKTDLGQAEEDDGIFSDESDEEADVPAMLRGNGTAAAPALAEAAKPNAAAKPAKDNKITPALKPDEDDSDDESDSDAFDDSDEDMMSKSDDSEADDDDDDDEDESEDEKPAKAESSKKRPNADAKTPEAKKAKLVTPQKTDGKKGAHTATPHPSKKGSKTPGSDKATPKSAGQVSCEPCKKTFNSDSALQSHNKAKHAAK